MNAKHFLLQAGAVDHKSEIIFQPLCRSLPDIDIKFPADHGGNILIQLVALGMLPSIDAGRRLIAKTERVTEYLPGDTAAWDAAHVRYEDLLRRGGKTEK